MAHIILAEDDASIRTVLTQALTRAGHSVEVTPNIARVREILQNGQGNVLLTDVILLDGNALEFLPEFRELRPELPIIVMSANNTFLTAIRASEGGAFEYLPKPFDLNVLLEVIHKALDLNDNAAQFIEPRVEESMPLIGRSPAMQEVYRTIARLTKTALSVVIFGESGTGKERVARALHDYSARKNAPFIALNMAAIPKDLIESELFGHERGAFTGAQNRKAGRFEQAACGTLFLDEIGDMPLEAQTRLLRVLQEGEFSRIGGQKSIKTDVRIIAASNKDLHTLVKQGAFREDLYYRLCVVPITLPPLRERAGDIPDLTQHFLKLAEIEGFSRKQFTPDAIAKMQSYSWPGNVRELENFVRRVSALYAQEILGTHVVDEQLSNGNPLHSFYNLPQNQGEYELQIALALRVLCAEKILDNHNVSNIYDDFLPLFERPILEAVLEHTKGNQIKAADILGLNRNTLHKKIQMLGLDTHKFK